MTSSGSPSAAPQVRASLSTELRRFLDDPCLDPLWDSVRNRLERNRLQATGVVTVDLGEAGADRLSGLLGRAVRSGTVRVKLADLDQALRASAAAAGVVAVAGELAGRALVDHAAAREDARRARHDSAALLDQVLEDAGLAREAWVPTFVDGVRRAGLLTRAGDAAPASIAAAGAVLAELRSARAFETPAVTPSAGSRVAGTTPGWWELAELASRCTGDAHGLDEGRLTAALVLRAAAAALAVPWPETPAGRRELWARLGVTPDLVSGTVLAWGLRPPGDDGWSMMIRQRANLGVVTHLTLQELRGPATSAQRWTSPGDVVSVAENPQVLQAAARAGVPGVLLCTSGNPASAGWLMLRGLVAEGASVRYHGDFDWPGVAIAGRVIGTGVRPWRMGAADYLDALDGLPADARLALSGPRAPTEWDPRLGEVMTREGVAVHQELLLPTLLNDLR